MNFLTRLFKRKHKLYSFEPDYVVRPSETIKETMEAKSITTGLIYGGTSLDYFQISWILADEIQIDEFIATELCKVLGSEPAFWMNLSKNYHDKKGGKEA